MATVDESRRVVSPAWLALPPSKGLGRPPTVTQLQILPLYELTWENFERLCYRIARTRGDVEGWAALYGGRGQKQEGIDVYVRRQGTGKYSCWQSKRKKLTAAALRAAIAEFEKGEWWPRSDQFCICTSSSIQDTALQVEIETQRTQFEAKGVDLQVLGQEEISVELKGNSHLVRSFFGRYWVAEFCTDIADQTDRLDADDVSRLRRELRTLYASNFSTLDPGIVVSTIGDGSNEELPLLNRFVEPDVELVTSSTRLTTVAPPAVDDHQDRNTSDILRPTAAPPTTQRTEDTVRIGVSAWVAGGDNAVLSADGGLGKSTCLRAFALDQLDDGGRFPAIAKRWPDAIPILLPFAFWVRLVEEDEANASFGAAVDRWLRKFDASQPLIDLMAQCLVEGRGLLLIDGLDEWSNEAAAKSALALLNTFVRSHNAPAIATGRPAGLARLGSLDPIWRRGRLAPLSESQQRALATIWLSHFQRGRAGSDNDLPPERGAAVQTRVAAFFGELGLAGALVSLAGTPLLLSGLISLHLRQVALPRSRFQAYEELVELLLEVHPSRRAQAALDRAPRYKVMIEAPMRREALAHFAFEKRKQGFDAGCPVNTAARIVATHLESMDGAGLPRADAVAGARELVVIGAEATGLIVEKAPQEVAFVHAIFEETLAGLHLGSLPIDSQLEFVRAHAGDPRWTTSILAMIHSFGRPTDADAVVRAIDAAAVDPAKAPVQQALIAEAVFGDFRCSPRLIRDLSPSFYAAVSDDGWLPYRQRLLRNIVESAGASRSGAEVRERSAAWFPDPENYRDSLYRALRTWPDDEALEALFLGLFNSSDFNKNAAAQQIVARFRGNPEVGDRLLALCHTVAEAETISAALEAYMGGWGDPGRLAPLIDAASASADHALRLSGIRGKIKLGTHDDDDLAFVLDLAGEQSVRLGEPARLFETLAEGWPNDERVLNVCWDAFREYGPKREIGRDLARAYLLASAVSGSDIDEPLGQLIEKDEHFFSMGLHGGYVRADYGPHVVRALDYRLEQTNEHFHNDIAHLGVMSRSEYAKRKLISLLDGDFRWSFWPVYGLLEGWGLSDPTVADALAEVISRPANQLQYVAHHLPQLIADKVVCRRRLLAITALPKMDRPDFVAAGFQRLGLGSDDKEVVDALLPHATSGRGLFAAVGPLILAFGSDPRVRAIAKQQMHTIDGPWSEIFEAYGNDPDMRSELSPFLSALGPNLRAEVVSTMEGRAAQDNAFIQSLSRYSLESDAQVRCSASIAYHEAVHDQPDAKNNALQVLAQEIQAIGPHMDTVRQAAFVGLVALNDLEILTELPEEERKWPIGHSAFTLGGNRRLFAYIARRWDRISRSGSPLTLFGMGERERWTFWDHMAPYIQGSDECRAAFLEYCAGESKAISSAALEALAREMPGSELLKAQCFRRVEFGQSDLNASALEDRQREFVAGRLIGLQFAADADTQLRTEAVSDDYISMKIAACSIAWRADPLLKREFDKITAGEPNNFVWLDAAYLAAAVGDDDAFTRMLLNMVNRCRGSLWDFLPMTVEPVVQRLVSSPGALDQLRRHLSDAPTCSDVASLPRLMSQADALDSDTRNWCEDVVRRELSGERMPTFGMDVTAGAIRPVAYSVLDSLVPM